MCQCNRKEPIRNKLHIGFFHFPLAPDGIPSGIFLVFRFVVEHTVTVALKIGVVYLLTKFFTDTFELLGFGKAAGTVAVAHFESLFDSLYYLFIFV